MLALAVLALSVARKAVIQVKDGWREPLNLYIVAALRSGERKSPVYADATKPVRDEDSLLASIAAGKFAGDKARREVLARVYAQSVRAAASDGSGGTPELDAIASQLEESAPRPAPRLIADDITPEKLAVELEAQNGRLAILSSEGGPLEMMAGRYSKIPNLDVYLKAHAGEDVRVDRLNRPPVHLKAPALTLGLTVQPDVVRALAGNPGFRGRGLLARFLYSLPASCVGSRDIRPPSVPDSVSREYWAAVTVLLELKAPPDENGEHSPFTVLFTADAYEMLMDFSEALERRMGPGKDLDSLTDWAGKLVGAIARIAALLHLVEADVGEPVSTYTTECALQIGEYLLAHARAAFALMDTDQETSDALYLLDWLKRHGATAFTQREASEGTKGRFRKVAQLTPILDLLVERRFIRPISNDSPPKRGRPSVGYEVNPLWASHYSQ